MTGDQVRVGDCMHAGVVSCGADAPLAEVARIMGDHRVHVVAVADLGHGRPYGTWRLVSHMDVVAAIATGQDVLAHEVAATEAVYRRLARNVHGRLAWVRRLPDDVKEVPDALDAA